jgi:arabinogalactan endo-1,4-beta-galactosidase
MKKYLLFYCIIYVLILSSCGDGKPPPNIISAPVQVRAADLSMLPEIEASNVAYKNSGTPQDPILTLKNAGCNYVRLRLWHTPAGGHCGLTEVKNMANRIRQQGLRVWLTVHFSDTWADPGQQTKPAAWQSLSFNNLKSTVASYVTTVMTEIQPDLIQIGNETNNGFLWPDGKLTTNETQAIQLMQAAISSVRASSSSTKILFHYGGLDGAEWFFDKVKNLDYDYIGLSYYPVYHGTSLSNLSNKMLALNTTFNKKVLLAETAYPFTLDWNDFTNNIVGLANQLVGGYDATLSGQKAFLVDLKKLIVQNGGIGFAYWGGEWIAFRGPQATNGSSWENQALWDFTNNAVPAIAAFSGN